MASSVVRITIGSTSRARVSEPAMIESPNPSVRTNSAMPNRPNTIDGTPLKLLVMTRITLTSQLSRAYSLT